MAKRFIDTDFYSHPFVSGLKAASKSLYSYIICNCSGAGIWIKNLQVASIYIGVDISEKQFEQDFISSGKAFDLQNGKYFFPDFIQHQYPSGLNQKNPAHNNFIKELLKYSLIDENLNINEATLKRLSSTFKGTKVMVKVKVKEEVKVEETVMETELQKKLKQFFAFRKEIKKPVAESSKESLNKKLMKLSDSNEQKAIEILEQSIANGWQGIFELKINNNGKSDPTTAPRINGVRTDNKFTQALIRDAYIPNSKEGT